MYNLLFCTLFVLVSIGACTASRGDKTLPPSETVKGIDEPTPTPPQKLSLRSTLTATLKPTDSPTTTSTATVIATATTRADITPLESLSGPQIIKNSSFDVGTNSWDRPYGKLTHTTSEYYTPPGAVRLMTTDETSFLDYRGNFGQCIDLSAILEDWPVVNDQKVMVLEAFLRSNAEISSITLNGIFSEDTQCGTGQVGFFEIPSIGSNQDWTRVTSTTAIPASANSLHVFINASGTSNNGAIYIDDIRAYPPDLPPNP